MTRETLRVEAGGSHQGDPAPEEKLEQLERILHSRVFHGSGSLATLLQYLVRQSIDDANAQVKEYTIALEVFGRGSEFDPRTNSVVRVQAKNLRAKLQEYYDTEGKSDKVLIELPKGHYRVVFSYIEPALEPAFDKGAGADAPPQPAPVPTDAEAKPRSRKPDLATGVLVAAVVILSVVVVSLAVSNINLRSRTEEPVQPGVEMDHAVVWAPFLKPENSTLLVLSNPPVFRFLNNSDSKMASREAMQISPEQAHMLARVLENRLVMKQGGAPKVILSTSSYTGMGEAIGLYYLTDMFRSAGLDLTLKQSRTVSAEDLKNRNVILLGSTWVNEWVEKLPVREDFIYGVNASIENKWPLPGEEAEYKPRYSEQTGEVEEDYALITVKPGVTDKHRLMILAGLLSEGTQAAAEFVTKKENMRELSRRLEQMSADDGPPKYYQVLLKVDVDDGIPTTASIVAIHPLKVARN